MIQSLLPRSWWGGMTRQSAAIDMGMSVKWNDNVTATTELTGSTSLSLQAEGICANGVSSQSPGSRSAPWVDGCRSCEFTPKGLDQETVDMV